MRIPTVTKAIKIREATREAHYGPATIESHLVACTTEYQDVLKLELDKGRFISDIDIDQRANNCVLSAGDDGADGHESSSNALTTENVHKMAASAALRRRDPGW